MKLQLDTVCKTIRIEESVNLDKLITTLESMLPNNLWKEFTLETNTVINSWNIPTIINPWIVPVNPQPFPWIIYDHNDSPLLNVGNGINQGIYCVETSKRY